MKITLPNFIYKEKLWWKNYIFQELIREQCLELIWTSITKNGFSGYELQEANNNSNKILVINKKTSSKIIDNYDKILLIKEWDLKDDSFTYNKNVYVWYKHPSMNEVEINHTYLQSIKESWNNFKIIEENKELWIEWLRKPQVGALYSIISNYTINNQTFTIVMPTWTWKTETMLAVLLKLKIDKLLIIVPSDALREQISWKFIKLWIFEKLQMIDWIVKKPVVWVLNTKLKNIEEFVSKTNVIVSTINIIWWLSDEDQQKLWEMCSHLFIDEAHHTPANTWKKFKNNFWEANIIQFTATPFRNDKKRIEWNIIYNYPLKKAQEEWYFKNIIFKPVLEPDINKSDNKIKEEAIKQLEQDINDGYDHILMARCKDIKTAEEIYNRYYNTKELQKYNPVLIHSEVPQKQLLLDKLKNQESKIVVCVDMLWEWYDLPNLKIAALHYTHKSLWVTLQFIWRFTRTSGLNLGDATFIANIADSDFWDNLKEMYSENSDWNSIISKQSSLHIEKQIKFQDFINKFWDVDFDISSIKAPLSSVFYKVKNIIWNSDNIQKAIQDNFKLENIKYWINEDYKLVIIIEQIISTPGFWNIKELNEIKYNLHLFSYDDVNNLFYILSDVETRKESIVKSFQGEYVLINNDDVFKSFDEIDFLRLFIVWLKEWEYWNLKYRMHAWIDIKSQLTSRDQINKIKSNIFGFWFNKWAPTSIWASRKWKVWAKLNWNVIEWKEWCTEIWKKLKNPLSDWKKVLDWVMDTTKIESIPNNFPISIDWNDDIYLNYDKVYFKFNDIDDWIWIEDVEIELFKINIEWIENNEYSRKEMNQWEIKFRIYSEWIFNIEIEWKIEWDDDMKKMTFHKIWWDNVSILKGNKITPILKCNKITPIVDYLNLHLPIIKYSNWEYLEWMYLSIPNYEIVWYNINNIYTRKWKDLWVDIKKESKIKNWVIQEDSIQNQIIQELKNSKKYDIIFNDDGSWEIADIIWIIYDKDNLHIKIEFYHCKYSWRDEAGARLWDLYEVCGQTQKSVRWSNMEHTLNQIKKRWSNNPNKYEEWDKNIISELITNLPFYNKIEKEFFIVQPWLSKEKISNEQKRLLETTEIYLKNTCNATLKIIASD